MTSPQLLKNNSTNPHYRKMRVAYILTVLITMILGLGSRKFSDLLPAFIAQNAGDVLWAIMVYFGFRFLLVRKSLGTAITLSFLFSYLIEFSQMYQADWINQLRGTVLGALILGKGYLTVDLIRYAAGIILAAVLNQLALMFSKRR